MKKILATTYIWALPLITFADTLAPVRNANDVVEKTMSLINSGIGVLIAVAVLFIVWHAVNLVMNGGSEDKRKEAQNSILWGVVGLFVILSIWGIVNILSNTFGTGNANGGQFNSSQDAKKLFLQ